MAPLQLVLVAASMVACSRSELEGLPTGGAGGSTATSTVLLPPPPPECQRVRFAACQPWPEPFVVSLSTQHSLRQDVAWQGQVHLVIYDDTEHAQTFVVGVTRGRQVLFRVPISQDGEHRIAYNPMLGAGMVVGDHGLQWLDFAGGPNGIFVETSPGNGSFLGADVGATELGFTAVVSPLDAPGDPPPAFYASLGPTPGSVPWAAFYDHRPDPSIEHCTGADGLADRFGFEAFSDEGIEIVVFEPADGALVGPVGAPYDLGLGTDFTDGMACDGPWSFFLKTSQWDLYIIGMHADGSSEGYAIPCVGSPRQPHLERLGTSSELGEIVIASAELLDGDTMTVAPWSPELGLGTPLVVGPGGADPRLARTGRGLALTWRRDGATLLQELDCCVTP